MKVMLGVIKKFCIDCSVALCAIDIALNITVLVEVGTSGSVGVIGTREINDILLGLAAASSLRV